MYITANELSLIMRRKAVLGTGGIADKQGNTYEKRFLGRQIFRLIKGDIQYIIVEPGEYIGADIVAVSDKDVKIYQCKAGTSKSGWTISRLKEIKYFVNSKSNMEVRTKLGPKIKER